MKGPLMTLIHFTLIVVGLALVLAWLMYSAGVHGHFRFRWGEWENWAFLLAIACCFALPVRAMLRREQPHP